MAKKLFEVEYDDDLHMADAADDPDYKRGPLYDDTSAHVCLGGQSFGAGKITQFIQCGCSRYARVCW